MRRELCIIFALAACGLLPVIAQEESPGEKKAKELVAKLNFQGGTIDLKDGLATLIIPANFAYLSPADSNVVLSEIWGNPPDEEVLGLIVPKEFNPLERGSWAVALTYDDSGYVSDDDADKTDYDDLLKDMQASMVDNNKEREKEGYPSIQIIGWAAAPHYDKNSHKLYWAKELAFSGDEEHTLNYNIRVLGRRGVLVLNAISGMSELPTIEKEMPEVIAMVDFKDGHRYADFNPKLDKVAGYGLAALVAGGIAAKTGLFKGILIALLAAKKFVIIGVIAVFALVKKFFFGKSE